MKINTNFVVSKRNHIRLVFSGKYTFRFSEQNFKREYVTKRNENLKLFIVDIKKIHSKECCFNTSNKWNILQNIKTGSDTGHCIYTPYFTTGRNEVLKILNQRNKGNEKDNQKKKENILDNEELQKMEKEKNIYENEDANVIITKNLLKTDIASSYENTKNMCNLKNKENDKILYKKRDPEANKSNKIYENIIKSSTNDNSRKKNKNLQVYLKNESTKEVNNTGRATLFLKNPNALNKAEYAIDTKTPKKVEEKVKESLCDGNVKTNKIGKSYKIMELLIYYRDKLQVMTYNLFEQHLLLMNCLIAGTLYFIADITCQLMEKKKEKKNYDMLRTLRMAFIGISLEGPVMTWWYGNVLSKFVKSKPNTFFYKSFLPTLFDNFVFGPIHLTIFFFYNGILKKQNKKEIADYIFNTGIQVFLVSLMTWTPITLINFFFVPRIYQATVIFVADFFWVNFLSWCANK